MATPKKSVTKAGSSKAKSAEPKVPARDVQSGGGRAALRTESDQDKRARALRIAAGLRKLYPEVETALDSETPFQLLVATILSAQCTDVAVNKATPGLFKRYPTPQKLAAAQPEQIEPLIATLTFFRQKAKSIRNTAAALLERHEGEVPRGMEELVQLAGVGRKTANVVRGCAFDLPAIIVDTHVKRVSARLGLTVSDDPEVIEQDLMALLPEKEWTHFTNAMIWHGRRICDARKPKCPECTLRKDCPYGQLRP